jgi:8-oxo-(d)GTP phosphatase
MDVRIVRAAGGVVWRRDDGGDREVALVHRPAYDDWSFPKGKLERGESELDAALREVEEETGLRASLGEDLGTVEYRDGKGRQKIVRYWEMMPVNGDRLRPRHEVDEARWVAVDEAPGLLTYDHDRRVLTRLTPVTVGTVVYVLRHALAGDRDRWDGPDERRPLTEEGWRQADAIAERDAAVPFATLLSSPYLRCVETLEPLAARIGRPIEARSDLAEGVAHDRLEAAIVAAATAGPAIVSVHGDQLVALVRDLGRRGIRPPEGSAPDVRKGSTWILTVRDGRIAAADYLAPPSPTAPATTDPTA